MEIYRKLSGMACIYITVTVKKLNELSKSKLGKKGFILAYTSQGTESITARKAWQQEREASLAVNKQTEYISTAHKEKNPASRTRL